jgi:hypothetical protein
VKERDKLITNAEANKEEKGKIKKEVEGNGREDKEE